MREISMTYANLESTLISKKYISVLFQQKHPYTVKNSDSKRTD